MYEKAPSRFKFTLKDNYEFNYLVYVDIMYLDEKSVLYIVDLVTSFKAARFRKDILT